MFAKPGLLEEGLRRAREAQHKEGKEWKRDPQKSLQQGCSMSLVAALDPELNGKSGEYLVDGDVSEVPPPEWAVSEGSQEKLWEESEVLVAERLRW